MRNKSEKLTETEEKKGWIFIQSYLNYGRPAHILAKQLMIGQNLERKTLAIY